MQSIRRKNLSESLTMASIAFSATKGPCTVRAVPVRFKSINAVLNGVLVASTIRCRRQVRR